MNTFISMDNKRRYFLKTACAPVVFSMFGISMLEACSSGDDDGIGTDAINTGNDGDSSQEKTLSIDLSTSDFSKLTKVGGWMNYLDQNILLLRISDTLIRAFSNICPHAGANNQWSHSNSKFTCSNHNKSFADDCSGSNSKLTCYTSEINGNILTVTL